MSDIDHIIKFISDWVERPNLLQGESDLPETVPDTLRKIDACLGAFWKKPPYPFEPGILDHNTKRGLFFVQDPILNPRQPMETENNLVTLSHENQGVWSFYYDSNDTLYLDGDWGVTNFAPHNSPARFPAKIDDALCFVLLGNFFFYMAGEDCEDLFSASDPWPEDATVKIWHHPAWGDWRGFWTNTSGSLFVYDGFGCIRK